MCGICGIVDFTSSDIKESRVLRMTKTLSHRGPDGFGVFVSKSTAMGHTRLSIIDLSPNGHQPMLSEDKKCVLVYNGEIYNFPELRRILERKGVRFQGNSDTEVVLKSYIEWGTNAFAMFNGMFALALWDERCGKIYIARDRFGIKPLYYYPLKSGVVFGSEIKAILASGEIERKINYNGLHEYIYYGTALGSNTIFSGIQKILPGHFLAIDKNGSEIYQFCSNSDVDPVFDDLETASLKLRKKLEEAVRRHLLSDVPVGVFLSGGIDSSTITALASSHYQGHLKTYSVGFDFDRGYNELPKAKIVAERFGTDHHELHILGKNIPQVLESLVSCHDEPFGDAANIPLYLLCEHLKGSVKVILQGDGGDEIFAGYRRYNVLAFERFWHLFSRIGAVLDGRLPHLPGSYRYSRFINAMKQPDPAMRMALLLTEESFVDPPTRVLSSEVRNLIKDSDPFSRYKTLFSKFSKLDPVQRMLYTDCNIILPDIFLEKVDKSTMYHGIEVRVPLLDNELTTYVMGLPSSMKVRKGEKKWLLRKAMRGLVPDTILNGKKTGFSVPYSWWLKEPLAEYMKSVLFDKDISDWGVFDRKNLEKCINDHTGGLKNNGFTLYRMLNLALWYKLYMKNYS